MGYYRGGDYYRGGGYYRAGGILGNIARAVTGTVSGAVRGFVTGGPMAGIVGAARGAVGATRANITADSRMSSDGGPSAYTPALRAAHNAVIARVHNTPQATAPKQLGSGKTFAGTGYRVGGRRMNNLNPKALNRATRRLKGFEKQAKKSLKALGLHVSRHAHTAPAARRGK